jgi:hypothetical protein
MKKTLLALALLTSVAVVANEEVTAPEETTVRSVESWLSEEEVIAYNALTTPEEKAEFLKKARAARTVASEVATTETASN